MPITSKADIKREDMTYSMLRRIIIRADFTAMLDLEGMVADINQQAWFNGKFRNYEKRLLNVEQSDNEAEDKQDLEGRVVKRFDDCTIAPERNVTLDIASKFVTMDIRCDKKYTSIDDYLSLFVETLAHIVHTDDYVKLQRLAIRKIDGMEFENGDKASEVFEYFDQHIADPVNDAFFRRTYTDSFVYGAKKVNVHYNRTVKIVGNGVFAFILDIDTYLDSDMIEEQRPDKAGIENIYKDRLNEASFELFKRGVKFEYLKSIVKPEANG